MTNSRNKDREGPKPGRILEMLTARIEGALSGANVKVTSPDRLEDKVSGGLREVDVSLRSTLGSTEVIVIVECRDRGRSSDVTWIEQVKTKRDAVGAAKAVAVASGTFSKKALRAAAAYGIDLRTLSQVNRAEVKRWTGAIQLVSQTVSYNNAHITVALAGPEPLTKEITDQFDELVRAQVFRAPFISYAGEEGLLSPLDVIRRMNAPAHPIPQGQPITVSLPPKSVFSISSDPVMMQLMGDLPQDGSSTQRSHAIRFEDGEAFFNFGGQLRSLIGVQLDFTAQLESKGPVEANAYRYVSASGVIEVADRRFNFGDGEIFVTEHRRVPEEPSS